MMKRLKLTGFGFGLAIVCALAMAAGVNGIFSHVTSTTGYQVNGSAGSAGQGLCSDGTNFNTPCAVGPGSLFYQTVTNSGSGLTQRAFLNADGTIVGYDCSPRTCLGLPNSGVTNGTYANPSSVSVDLQGRVTAITAGVTVVPRTCNAAGCYAVDSTGTMRMWGHSITINDGAPGTNVCFPIAFPVGIDSATLSDDFNVGATSTPSVAGLSPSGGTTPSCSFGGLWVWGTRTGNAVYWQAIGH